MERHIITLTHRGRRAAVDCTCGFHVNCKSARVAGNTIARHRTRKVFPNRKLVAERSRAHVSWWDDLDDENDENDELVEVELRSGETVLVPRSTFYLDRGPAEWRLQ